jgi:hypothetical protein
MDHVVYARIERYFKIYVNEEESEGKTTDEIVELARQKLKDEGEDILCEDDMPFEYECDVKEVYYGYDF